MDLKKEIYPYKPEYPEYLTSYVSQIKEAIRLNKHHDHRRSLFINYLQKSYGVKPEEVEIEQKIKVAHVRGFIDAFYKYLIFEFKTNLEAERPGGITELDKYFKSRKNPEEYMGIMTDGLDFEVYQYTKGKINRISSFTLVESDPLSSFRYLDDLIFASKKTTPTSLDITTRFGPYSAIFNRSLIILDSLFDEVESQPSVKVKFKEWNSLLGRVYGDTIGDKTLFLKHTYLTIFSRLLVTNALYPNTKKTKGLYKGLITGSFFAKHNLPNFAEPDFFSWALDVEIEADFIGFLSKIDKYLSPFQFDKIDEDILKAIYQELVDPESRHSLGEYYTPDWIADIALDSLKYKEGRILDPACGSGSFLLATIRCLRKNGIRGNRLVKEVMDSIIGIDVHPLAVMMTKANIILAIAGEIKGLNKEVYLPIYMSDTLMTSEDKKTNTIAVKVSESEAFHIPLNSNGYKGNVDELIDKLSHACQRAVKSKQISASAWKGFSKKYLEGLSEEETFFWRQNFILFSNLIKEGRDTIWAFILKNAYRPSYIRSKKVDYVVGNPPWLAYRYIKDKSYKSSVKKFTLDYELLKPNEIKLFTQMDTSTLFFVYCEHHFLKENGKIAFVLPKTTILPAKQHFGFQKRGLTEIHDFSNVSPLFNVRSILAIRDKSRIRRKSITTYQYHGNLPLKNIGWKSAKTYLSKSKIKHSFKKPNAVLSYYYNRFLQGATIVPRCFWFIQKDKSAALNRKAPYLETSDEAFAEAKPQWKMKITGRVENRFIFETVLAKDIIPFAVKGTDAVFLPLVKKDHSIHMADSSVLLENGFEYSSSWMQDVDDLWTKNRKSEDRSLIQRLNYNQTLIKQNIDAPYVVLYNTSGTNLTASLYIRTESEKSDFKSNGFIADAKTYYYYPRDIDEAFYIIAVLNSNVVNIAIKEFQPQGLYGERDIHRRPFEVCTIPRYDKNNNIHISLSNIGRKCFDEVQGYIPKLRGRVGRLRTEVRKILKLRISKINNLVEKLLIQAGQSESTVQGFLTKNGDFFKKN